MKAIFLSVAVITIIIAAFLILPSNTMAIVHGAPSNDLDSSGFERISETVSIIDSDSFNYGFDDKYGIYTVNLEQKSFLETGKTYYVIHKIEPKQPNFPNATQFIGKVGYAFQPGEVMPNPKEKNEYMERLDEFVDTSIIGDSYEFVVDPQKSFFVKFAISIDQEGRYSYQFYQKDIGIGGSIGTGTVTVVQQYSKAIGENGECKEDDLTLVIKHDYSTIVCTSKETKSELQNRGWALR